MASLEQELGVPLFEKRGRGVNLTKAGKLFLEYADRIVEDCRVAMEKMSELASDGGRGCSHRLRPSSGRTVHSV